MVDEPRLLRREYLQSSGTITALSGCLNSDGYSEKTEQVTESAENFQGGTVETDHLLTDSRNADVVVWKDDDGTVYADAEDQVIASGSDFSAVAQAAIDAGASKLVIQDGHYVAGESLDLTSGTIVTGMGMDTTIEVAGSAAFNAEGAKTGSAALTADVQSGADVIPVADTSSFEVGQHVLVNSNRQTDYRSQKYGEIQEVTAVDASAGQITITEGGLFDSYRTSNGAQAVALDMVQDVTVRDMEIVGTDQQVFRSGVMAAYGNRIFVQSCKMHDLAHSGVIYTSSTYSAVDNCEVFDVAFQDYGVGYGVTLADAVRNITVRNSVFHGMKNHCTTVGGSGADGFPRLLTFRGNQYYDDDADVHLGGAVQFENNRFANGTGGILTGADATYVNGCEFRNIAGDAIEERGNPTDLVINNSQFRNIQGRAIDLYDSPEQIKKIGIAASDFTNVSGPILRFRPPDGHETAFVGVTENVVQNCGNSAFVFGEPGTSKVRNVNFVGNHIEDVAGLAISAQITGGPVRLMNNTIHGAGGSYAVEVAGPSPLVANNDFQNYADRGLLVWSSGLVAGNNFAQGSNDAVLLAEADDVFVTNNNFEATEGIDVNALDSTNCKIVQNDVATRIDAPGESNVVRENFGYQTEDTGTHTTSGTGGRSFSIPHDLVAAPEVANVWAESADAAGAFYVSGKGPDAITVTYQSAPPTGSGNLSWGYEATTYQK